MQEDINAVGITEKCFRLLQADVLLIPQQELEALSEVMSEAHALCKDRESSGPGIPRTIQCQEMLLLPSAKDPFLDARRALWVTGCISHGLVRLTGSAVGLRGFLQLCLVPPLSAKTS